jgi:hypothetical protein
MVHYFNGMVGSLSFNGAMFQRTDHIPICPIFHYVVCLEYLLNSNQSSAYENNMTLPTILGQNHSTSLICTAYCDTD